MTNPPEPDRPMPTPPPLSESELRGAAPAPVPKEVTLSFWLWVAGAVLGVIGGLLLFGMRDEVLAEVRQQPDTAALSPAELDAVVTVSLVFGFVIVFVLACLYLLFAFKARAGRNWARIVLLILTVLSVLGQLAGNMTWLGIISVLVAVAAAVLLFLPASNEYFAARKRTR